MSTTRRKGATPQKAHKVEVSFTNWVMGGSLLSLSTNSTLGNRVSSKGSHKHFDVDTDDEEPPDPTPPAPQKVPKKKKEVPPREPKKAEEVKVVCNGCQPEPEKPVGNCAPDCPVCKEECAWEKHMHEKYGGMECDTCGRGANWLMDEFHKGRGEYACEKCTPDCAACGRGPLWLSKKWEKTLKRRARKLQGVENAKNDKKDKKDDDGKKDKEDGGSKEGKADDGQKPKDKGKEKAKNKEKDKQKGNDSGGNKEDKEKDKAEDKSAEKGTESTSKEDAAQKKNQGGKGKNTHEWTSEEDAKLKELKSQNKSWKDIASDMGIDAGLCKTRHKNLEHSGDAGTGKKDKNSSGDKQSAGGGDSDGILGGFGDWNNDDSNKKQGSSGNTDNQGWGAPDNSNTNGETSGAGDNGWGTNDNSNNNATANAEGSSWENNNSSTNADTSGGDNGNSSWENNNNTTTGDAGNSNWDSNNNNATADAGNQGWGNAGNSSWNNNNDTNGDSGNQGWGDTTNSGWGNDESNKTSNDTGGNKDNQQSQSKDNGGGKQQNNQNEDNNQYKQNDIFAPIAPITESNPTGYIPYKSANNAAGGTSAWDTGATASFQDATAAQSSGGLPNTGNADISGSGWGAPNAEWDNNKPSNGYTGNDPGRDPWAQTEGQNDSGNGGASTSGIDPSNPGPADNGWFTVTESNLEIPISNNTGLSWSQLPSGGGTDAWNKPENASQHGGSSKSQARNFNNNNNNATYWNHPNDTNQAPGDGGNPCGQGNSSNRGGDCSFGSNWNNLNPGSFNNGNNGGFNFNNNSNGFSQGHRSQGRLRPNGVWSQEDCLKLEFLYSKNHEYMWKQIQADFYNWTRRFVPSELIQQKFREDGYA